MTSENAVKTVNPEFLQVGDVITRRMVRWVGESEARPDGCAGFLVIGRAGPWVEVRAPNTDVRLWNVADLEGKLVEVMRDGHPLCLVCGR